jgi:hypothetical protein
MVFYVSRKHLVSTHPRSAAEPTSASCIIVQAIQNCFLTSDKNEPER